MTCLYMLIVNFLLLAIYCELAQLTVNFLL
jgi:hypothetical protein